MRLFELDEATKEPVVVRVTDERVVENVVLEIVFLDLLTKWDSVSLRVKKVTTIATANEVPTTLH